VDEKANHNYPAVLTITDWAESRYCQLLAVCF